MTTVTPASASYETTGKSTCTLSSSEVSRLPSGNYWSCEALVDYVKSVSNEHFLPDPSANYQSKIPSLDTTSSSSVVPASYTSSCYSEDSVPVQTSFDHWRHSVENMEPEEPGFCGSFTTESDMLKNPPKFLWKTRSSSECRGSLRQRSKSVKSVHFVSPSRQIFHSCSSSSMHTFTETAPAKQRRRRAFLRRHKSEYFYSNRKPSQSMNMKTISDWVLHTSIAMSQYEPTNMHRRSPGSEGSSTEKQANADNYDRDPIKRASADISIVSPSKEQRSQVPVDDKSSSSQQSVNEPYTVSATQFSLTEVRSASFARQADSGYSSQHVCRHTDSDHTTKSNPDTTTSQKQKATANTPKSKSLKV